MTPILEARGLRVAVPDRARAGWLGVAPMREIVRGVNLTLPRGDALGLVGESGSGKSTLGRALIRLIPPSGGDLSFDGQDIALLPERALRPLRARMQMIFQDPHASLNPRLTIAETLARPFAAFGHLKGRHARRERAAALLETVGLPAAFLDRHPHALSGGQRQRVGIARAIALEPDLIIADEVVSGLDVSSQAQILALLRELRQRLGLALVFISHDLSVVRMLCDSVAVMRNGVIVETGPCAAIFSSPAHPYTRALIDAIPLPEIDPGWLGSAEPTSAA